MFGRKGQMATSSNKQGVSIGSLLQCKIFQPKRLSPFLLVAIKTSIRMFLPVSPFSPSPPCFPLEQY